MPHISSVSHFRQSRLNQRAVAMRSAPTTSEEALFQLFAVGGSESRFGGKSHCSVGSSSIFSPPP